MRTVSVRLADLERCTIPIGFVDENLHTRVRFDCKKMFDEYPTALPSMAVSPPEGSTYPAIVTKDGDYVVWDVTASDCASDGTGEIQLTFVVGEIVAKSYVGRIRVTRSLNPSGEIPDPVQDWITQANAVLAEIPETIDTALAEAKASGEFDGADGRDGADGQNGADGFSPSVSVSSITGGHRVSVTDAEGTESFDVMDGEKGDKGETGAKGDPGNDYVLTEEDKEEIAEQAAELVDLSEIIVVQDTTPISENTEIWFPETAPAGIEVPTTAELNAGLSGKITDPVSKSSGDFLVFNGTAWVAQSLSAWQGGSY